MILRILLIFLMLSGIAFGKTIKVQWEYSEPLESGGFKLYHKAPADSNYNLVQDIPGPEIREWEGEVELVKGNNHFVLTAYDNTESPYSAMYPLEWIISFEAPVFKNVIVD